MQPPGESLAVGTHLRYLEAMPVPESQRNTVQVKLRLDPDTADRLRWIAHAWGVSMGDVVETALDALDGKHVPASAPKGKK